MKTSGKRAVHQRVTGFLRRCRQAVRSAWLEEVQRRSGSRAPRGRKRPVARPGPRKDLLSLLLRAAGAGWTRAALDYTAIFRQIRDPDYLISDFHMEVCCLERVVERCLRDSKRFTDAELLEGLAFLRGHLSRIVEAVLEATADVYEMALERGGSGFCHVGRSGKIVFANQEMVSLLGAGNVVGKTLTSFLAGEQREFVREVVSGKRGDRPQVRLLEVRRPGGEKLPVSAEIVPLVVEGQRVGACVSFVDVSATLRVQTEVFDRSPLGIVKLNRKGHFTYANPAAREICAADRLVGRHIHEVFPDEENRAIVDKQIARRFGAGKSAEYDAVVTQLTGQAVPVRIAAMPEHDLQGAVVGTTAIVHNRLLDRTAEAIHGHLDRSRAGLGFLDAVAREIGRVVPFDWLSLARFSSDMKHAREVFACPQEVQPWHGIRYWPVPAYVAEWVRRRQHRIDDIREILKRPKFRELRKDKMVQFLLSRKLLSVLFYPVFREGRALAALVLYRRGTGCFTENDRNAFEDLPYSSVVMTALAAEDRRHEEFRFALMRDLLAECEDPKKPMQLLTDRLVDHHGWKNATMFRIDIERKKFVPVSQTVLGNDAGFRLPKGFTQDIHDGILGEVYRTKRMHHLADLETHPKRQKDRKVFRHSKAELSVPILDEGKVRWVLHIEDSEKNPFSCDEIGDLQALLKEIGMLLGKARLHHLLGATLERASDALIVTDAQGRVRRANPAAMSLLRCDEEDLVGKSLRSSFREERAFQETQKQIQRGLGIPGRDVLLRTKDKADVRGRLSASPLPDELGGAVFVIKDVTAEERVRELEDRTEMYHDLASQTRPPMSLAMSWVRRLRRRAGNGQVAETLDKLARQLHRVEVSYDRLVLYDREEGLVPYNEVLLTASELTGRVLEQLPSIDREKVVLDCPRDLPAFRGDLFQLGFCLESILSCLLSFLPEEGRVLLGARQANGRVVLRIEGPAPPPPRPAAPPQDARADVDLTLGEQVIRRFVKRHGGRYRRIPRPQRNVEFRIALPVERRAKP